MSPTTRTSGTAGRLLPTYLATSATAATGMVLALTVSAIAAERMLGSPTWSGLPMAASILGMAMGSHFVGRQLEHRSLRMVLASQYTFGLLGAGLAAAAVGLTQVVLLPIGLALLGFGHGATQYMRYLAADLVAERKKALVLSWVVWTTGFGAVVGPSLLAPTGQWATARGLAEVSGPYLGAALAFALCATLHLVTIPRAAYASAAGTAPSRTASPASTASSEQPTGTRVAWPAGARLALVAMVSGHAVMVVVMTMTPIHLTGHGHGLGHVGIVISAHMAGMYMFAPLVGWLVGRLRPWPVLIFGALLLMAATLLAALGSTSSGSQLEAMSASMPVSVPMSAPLFLLGLGWNFGFVAGSTLLNESLLPGQRLRGRGLADAAVWSVAALSSLSSSVLFARIGFAQLSWLGFLWSAALLAVLLVWRKAANSSADNVA